MKTNTNTKGFTLIELLVVVAIIGFLSSVVLTSVADARDRAQVAANQLQIQEFQRELALCVDDFGGDLPADTLTCIGNGGSDCLWGSQTYSEEQITCSTAADDALLEQASNLAAVTSVINVTTGTVAGGGLPGQYAGVIYHVGWVYWPVVGGTTCNLGTVVATGGNGVICGAPAAGGGDTTPPPPSST